MPPDRLSHRSEGTTLLERYSTRILIGFVASLSTILVSMYVPLSFSSRQVGWSTRSADRITLSMVKDEDRESNEDSEKHADERPPPTQHGVREPRTASGAEEGTANSDENGKDETAAEKETEPHVRRLGALTAKDRNPQIVGGMGALYLQIDYPRAAQEQGIEGRVKLDFTVGTDGTVRRIRVAKSLHPLCDSAAVRALRSVTFRPARRGEDVVPVRMRLPIRFKLRSDTNVLQSERPSSG